MKSYTIDKDLGQGTFSKVKLGIHKLTNEPVAIKIIDKTKQQDQDYVRIHREIQILRKLRHINVVQLFEIVESDTKLYIITEYANGGELFDYIVSHKRLEEREAARLFIQLINAVSYIHEHRIVHRDLKPENVLLSDGILKVIDFGLSSMYQQGQKLKTPCGSPCYAAPEMLQGLHYDGLFTDIWSSGIILYAMICGCVPFEDQNTKRLYEKIKTSDFHLPSYVSVQAADLLKRLLMKDPQQRITLDEIKKHDFIKFGGKHPVPQPLKLDHEIVQMVVQLGIGNKQEIIDMINNNKHNQITTTYYLLLNKRVNVDPKLIETTTTAPYIFKIKVKNTSPFPPERQQDTSIGNSQSPRRNVANITNVTFIKKIRAKTKSQEPIPRREPSVQQVPLSKQTRQVTKGQLGELFKKVALETDTQPTRNKQIITDRVSAHTNSSLLKIPQRQGRLSLKVEQKPLQTQPNERGKQTSNPKKPTEISQQQKLLQMDSIAMSIQSNIQNRFLIYKRKQ